MFNGLPLCGREVGEKIAIPEKIVIFVNQKQSTQILYYETYLFSAMGHPFQQFAEMMSRSSATSG